MTINIITGGIDTSKSKLDVAIHNSDEICEIENTKSGWKALCKWFTRLNVTRIGIEASGGYERGIVQTLRRHGIEVVVIQPKQVKAFARLHLRHAKNDPLDAKMIAACTTVLTARECPPDERLDAMAQHLTFIEQTEEDITRLKVRLEHIHNKRLRDQTRRDIARCEKRRVTELAKLRVEIETYQDLKERLELVGTIAGIGLRTAITLIVRMPELGHVSREEAAALVGLAPFDDDSGKRRGQRRIIGGRARVRRALYAASLPAAFRWNTGLIELYQRLKKQGKPHKVALVACARKLLIYANTVLKRGTPWTASS